MKQLFIFFVLFAVISSTQVNAAKPYCPPMPKPEKEGDPWSIPESSFTKENATKAIKELESQVTKGVKARDFMIDNELLMIKGYLYIAYLKEFKNEFGKEDIYLKKEFCKFIQDDAYYTH